MSTNTPPPGHGGVDAERTPSAVRDDSSSASSSTRYADIHTHHEPVEHSRSEFTKEENEQVQELARQISRYSTQSHRDDVTPLEPKLSRTMTTASSVKTVNLVNPFLDNTDPSLDPNSEKFNARKWTKTLLKLQPREDGYDQTSRTAGIMFRNLSVHGFGAPTDYQKDVANIWLQGRSLLGLGQKNKIQILRDFEGVVRSGEMCVVLGRPGSGCSTFLKTVAGETHGVYIDEKSEISYQGIPNDVMHDRYRGEVIYQAETDIHFPQLTVGQTLDFAAKARAPRNRLPGVTRDQYAEHSRAVIMALFGLSHTLNTPVGNDFIRGVSGGERKRVSIAEVALSGSPLQCWDNSTRGLDSATAIEFVKTLRMNTDLVGNSCLLAIYQAPQAAYDNFDKAIVLYEGRQIYFGKTTEAKQYFTDMGFICRERSTTADFLTSITNPAERIVAPGFENSVPRTANDFAARWKESEARKKVLEDIASFEAEYPLNGHHVSKFQEHRAAQKVKSMRPGSPYTISIFMQIQLCMIRGFQRLRNDMTLTMSALIGNTIMALVIGSVFYDLPADSSSFFSRGALLFFAVLMNAFASALEILTLYAQRPIVEKHAKYALYHPFAEAVSSMLVDMPSKMLNAIFFNLTLYFMTNLRREVDKFFIFLLFTFFTTLVMSNIFRTIAAISRTIHQAMPLAAIFILALVVYTGFTIPTRDMKVYMRWINYINPIAYAFEALLVNEFSGRDFPCVNFVPSDMGGILSQYTNVDATNRVCSTVGSKAGSSMVSGDAFLQDSYKYSYSHLWRNFGIIIAFFFFFLTTYLVATEYIAAAKSKGEVLVFRRGKMPAHIADDEEGGVGEKQAGTGTSNTGDNVAAIQKQTAVFHWSDVCYDIKIKDGERRLLDHIDGWVKPGTLTALMGVSGAGKTTLLDVLANRVTMGVVTGNMCVDGHQRDDSFQRKTGYVQQQDLHLATSTVREALQFSALLRQPKTNTYAEKMAYAEEVIDLLEMRDYADAVVGVPGEGLNVEQRKRLTIGVELAAKPELLLFLDEPTSGLDSQTAWSICALMRKLANNGQAILCTIHQPSAVLFQEFDRLLFLARGGKTVYFGPIGQNSNILTSYFERNGGPKCPPDANPAEWMLEVIGAAPGAHTEVDWFETWSNSPEKASVKAELEEMTRELAQLPRQASDAGNTEFAVPYWQQLWVCTKRVFEQYWRTPTYIYSKTFLCGATALFIGFSFFMAKNNQQGLQNQMFSIFMLLTIFGNVAQQMMPHFVTQRSLYEVRERPSKAYSWTAFMAANIIVEIPWQSLMALITFVSWYYPIGLYRNAEPTDSVNERAGLMFLLILGFYLWISTFSHMLIAGIETAETGGNIGNLLFSLSLIFCGVLAAPGTFPQFWIFLYRVSPFTYLVSAMLSTGVAGTNVTCSDIETLHFSPPSGQTCGEYLAPYLKLGGGAVYNPNATADCDYCAMSTTDQFLAAVNISYDDRWRNFGLIIVYIAFNIAGAMFLYWLARVPKRWGKKVN
ncbi:ABC-2 type transporter-domain-containing protein [Geopyxis carbonaria]|nr:ABC-2 type transporter-domain-containing protein [Geopyxis carbonaria]